MRRNSAHLGNLPPKLVDLISRELGRISRELGRGTPRLGAARWRAVSGATAAAAAAARRHERRVERRARLGGLLRRGGEGAVVSACMQGAGGSIATACSPAVRAIKGNQGQSMEIEGDRGRSHLLCGGEGRSQRLDGFGRFCIVLAPLHLDLPN